MSAKTTIVVRNYSDGTSLAAGEGGRLRSRDSTARPQTWILTEVDSFGDGVGICTFSSTASPGTCLQAAGVGAAVTHEAGDGESSAQLWVVEPGGETTIGAVGSRGAVLQGNGPDAPVTLVRARGTLNQRWILHAE
ncbi:RICIN domain-containing protein [Kitasatospora sp. NBC_01250]|uniref:RICIN domain-containing protein n=1 Tax=Kitasatospora sp. NBC_01250 TaxID=2903571 RepID=UPI002E2FCA48|nr:RICIN domain-containing protein [Kitasatospora sp. NBC_01250]